MKISVMKYHRTEDNVDQRTGGVISLILLVGVMKWEAKFSNSKADGPSFLYAIAGDGGKVTDEDEFFKSIIGHKLDHDSDDEDNEFERFYQALLAGQEELEDRLNRLVVANRCRNIIMNKGAYD